MKKFVNNNFEKGERRSEINRLKTMETKEYRTKTIFKESDNAKLPAVWCVGLDIGYSSVKTFSGNSISCFPSYATKATGNSAISINGLTDETDIQYVDENNELWDVGAKAQDTIDVSDTSAGSLSIYDRDRYYSAMFMVIMRVGIAAGLRKNQFGDPKNNTFKPVYLYLFFRVYEEKSVIKDFIWIFYDS